MATSKEQLCARLRSALEPRGEVLEAYLFGSQARGQARPHSDVDVAVYLAPTVDPHPLGDTALDLAAEVIRALHRNDVDLVVLNRAPPLLYHRVLRDGVRILSRDLAVTTTREARALSRYCDFLHPLEMIERATRATSGEVP